MSVYNTKKYQQSHRRGLAQSLQDYLVNLPQDKRFSLDLPGSVSLATWFLGPKAENQEWFEELVLRALRTHADARREYAPDDPVFISEATRESSAFIEGKRILECELEHLMGELKSSVPFYSHRWQGHMNWDVTLPCLVGFIAALPYNPNNVAAEASPVTTILELQVGQDLCKMLGYDVPSVDDRQHIMPWGHITCDGSVANLESMWFARNIKYLPVAIAEAIKHEPVLSCAKDLLVRQANGSLSKLITLNSWDIVNIPADEAIELMQKMSDMCYIPMDKMNSVVSGYLLQEKGWLSFYQCFSDRLPTGIPKMVTPATAHYSWPKNAAILGLGDSNRIAVHVDDRGRMQIDHLREVLEDCLDRQQPVIQVMAVLGSTEEGAVDPIQAIVDLRQEFRQKGLDFSIHVDAAWGGYFASMLRNAAQVLEEQEGDEFSPVLALSEYVEKQIRAMNCVETITVDPHKAGYCNYPAGALCYRNRAFRDVVTFTASVVYHGGLDVTVGVYGVEGSKPGAAAAAVWLSHRVLRTDISGYGKLLGRANFNHKRWYCAIMTMNNPDDPFTVTPFHALPVDQFNMSSGDILNWIRQEIVLCSDEDIVRSPEKMFFLRNIGSDMAIAAYTFNFKRLDGVLNTDLMDLNTLNQKIFEKLSLQDWSGTCQVPEIPLFVTASDLDPDIYGADMVSAYLQRIGVKSEGDTPVKFLISTTMNPIMSNIMGGNYIPHLMDIYRKTVLSVICSMLNLLC